MILASVDWNAKAVIMASEPSHGAQEVVNNFLLIPSRNKARNF